ncbi:E3 ubiquitin-protein ligase SHPRH [Balamuthia mandrillaris]
MSDNNNNNNTTKPRNETSSSQQEQHQQQKPVYYFRPAQQLPFIRPLAASPLLQVTALAAQRRQQQHRNSSGGESEGGGGEGDGSSGAPKQTPPTISVSIPVSSSSSSSSSSSAHKKRKRENESQQQQQQDNNTGEAKEQKAARRRLRQHPLSWLKPPAASSGAAIEMIDLTGNSLNNDGCIVSLSAPPSSPTFAPPTTEPQTTGEHATAPLPTSADTQPIPSSSPPSAPSSSSDPLSSSPSLPSSLSSSSSIITNTSPSTATSAQMAGDFLPSFASSFASSSGSYSHPTNSFSHQPTMSYRPSPSAILENAMERLQTLRFPPLLPSLSSPQLSHQSPYHPYHHYQSPPLSSSASTTSAAPYNLINSCGSSNDNAIDLTSEEVDVVTLDSEAEDEDVLMEVPYGQIRATILGMEHFQATVRPYENLSLVPRNNPDTIQVNNEKGEVVGFLDTLVTECFHSLLQRGTIRINAFIMEGNAIHNRHKMPVLLQLWGRSKYEQNIVERIRRHGYFLFKYMPVNPHDKIKFDREQLLTTSGEGGSYNVGGGAFDLESEIEKLFDSIRQTAENLPEQEPPPSITTPLFPHQKQALHWMMEKEHLRSSFSDEHKALCWTEQSENGEVRYVNTATTEIRQELPRLARGGILADEMGLGKTLCVISAIAADIENLSAKAVSEEKTIPEDTDKDKAKQIVDSNDAFSSGQQQKVEEGKQTNSAAVAEKEDEEAGEECGGPTLIVCPLSVLANWQNQLEQHVKKGTLSVFLYHGRSRAIPAKELQWYDVVLTTYSILGSEFASNDKQKKKQRPKPQQMYFQQHLSNGDSSNSSTSTSTSSAFPSQQQYFYYTPSPSFNGLMANTPLSQRYLAPAASGDVGSATVTPRIAEDQKDKGKGKEKSTNQSPLQAIHWRRIVLDEGHSIKSRKTRQARAAFNLSADIKWCLSGTPIQNKLEDLYSIVHFLGVHPFSNWDTWNAVIVRPMRADDPRGYQRLQALVGTLSLRRTKDQMDKTGRPLVVLPSKTVLQVDVTLSDEERQLYDAMASEGKQLFQSYIKAGTLLKNYAHVLEMLLRLRQVCCHANLSIAAMNEKKEQERSANDLDNAKNRRLLAILMDCIGEESCCICLNPIPAVDAVITHCAHMFCRPCISQAMERNPTCPLCRSNLTPANILRAPVPELGGSVASGSADADGAERLDSGLIYVDVSNWKPSSKVIRLLEEIKMIMGQDPTTKSVIFSQWTSFLDYLHYPLEANGIRSVRLDGRMTHQQREEAMKQFGTDPDVHVLLISLKAGGVGLNLTCASVVFMMDPWWNPAAEEQAMDRIHRLGQTKPVRCIRFIVKDSVEEQMLKLQEKKKLMLQGAFGKKTAKELQELRISDLKLLMFNGDENTQGDTQRHD